MEIVNTYDIASANLAIALETDSVSTEQREAVRTAVGEDIDLMMDALNAVIVSYNAKVYTGKISNEKAEKFVKAEYKAIGFTDMLDYKYLNAPISLFYSRGEFVSIGASEQVGRIKEMWQANQDCPVARVQDAVAIYTLRLLSHLGLITTDLEFTRTVMGVINDLDEARKTAAILPPAIVTEL